jgi:HEPN domain-containing protein
MVKRRSSKEPSEIQRFYRAAVHRYDEARFLLERGQFTTAAIYLGGYAVECALKALVLSYEPTSRHPTTMASFRGTKAHDFEWLRQELIKRKCDLPEPVRNMIVNMRSWSVQLRYDPKAVEIEEADTFLRSAEEILVWVKGRL